MVMAKIHEQIQDELSAYLDNELAPDTRTRIAAHLRTCDDCSNMLTAFQRNREQIRGLEHRAPASIQHAVMAQIRQQAAQATVEKPTRPYNYQILVDGYWILDAGFSGLLPQGRLVS